VAAWLVSKGMPLFVARFSDWISSEPTKLQTSQKKKSLAVSALMPASDIFSLR
jgi:hypothetical protein